MAVTKGPCDICGSSDNLATYDNGSIWCFTPDCKSNKERSGGFLHKDPGVHDYPITNSDLLVGQHSAIPVRRLSQRTCEFFNYMVGVDNGESVQIANYDGGQKIRTKDKKFYWKGSTAKVTLFGKHKWSGHGNSIIITEGEIDALSIAEAQDCKWPVVSLPNGAASARKTLQAELDWLLGYKSIIICFDSDDAGKSAVESVVDLFPAGRLKIASLSEKDANDCLAKGKFEELAKLVFNAAEYRPDGIIWGDEIDVDELFRKQPRGLSLPYPALDDSIRGLKDGRIYTIYAGTGNGKSTSMREIALHVRKEHPEIKIANIFLEESLGFTALSYMAMEHNIPAYKIEENPNLLTKEQKESGKKVISDMGFYKHFGSLDSKHLFNLLDYVVIGKGVKLIMLDHISLLVSGMRSESGEGERRDIDMLVTNLRSFCERTKAIIVCATQLKRKEKSYSKGGEITEADARGSGAIEHISDVVFSLNVNNEESPFDAQIKIIKNRITGWKGNADLIAYNPETGRYLPKKVENIQVENGDMY
jgi:twinkle protein